jgi:Kef-type K+ transport system membrane component KefB
MSLGAVSTLLMIAIVAVLAPILAKCTGRLAIPGVVVEIILGIVIGPSVLGLAHTGGVITGLASMGLSFLMFLAGLELDLSLVRGRPLRLAITGWMISLGLALAIASALVLIGTVLDAVVIGLALTTTALGTLLPILRDNGLSEGRFGTRLMAIGSVGEFGPILVVGMVLDRRNPEITSALLLVFVIAAVAAAALAARPHPPAVVRFLHQHVNSSAQLPIRVAMLFIVGLVLLAFKLGLDVLLGAFAAGIVVRLFIQGEDTEVVQGKLEAIGFGFLVPVFFIVSGMQFDLRALIAKPAALALVPLFLVLLLVVRGTPVLLYRGDLPRRELLPLALRSATGLPLIVVITTIGVAEGRMRTVNAAALVAAGMLSVLLYPALAKLRLRRNASVAGADDLAAQRIQDGELVRGEGDIQGGHVLLEPLDALGTGDRGHANAEPFLLGVNPGQGDLRRRHALRVGHRPDRVHDGLIRLGRLGREPRVAAAEVLGVQRAQVHGAGQESAAERGVGHEADTELAHSVDGVGLDVASPQ